MLGFVKVIMIIYARTKKNNWRLYMKLIILLSIFSLASFASTRILTPKLITGSLIHHSDSESEFNLESNPSFDPLDPLSKENKCVNTCQIGFFSKMKKFTGTNTKSISGILSSASFSDVGLTCSTCNDRCLTCFGLSNHCLQCASGFTPNEDNLRTKTMNLQHNW